MDVILMQDVDKVGKAGSVVKVSDGYARNYLFPHKLAVISTQAALKKIEEQQQRKRQEHEKTKKEAEAMKTRLAALSLTIPALVKEDEKDKLYGSVSVQDILTALSEEGVEIDKNIVLLPDAIKALGIYEVPIKLHPEVIATLKVWIVKK
jgi:large subunit ribosomal protein L9